METKTKVENTNNHCNYCGKHIVTSETITRVSVGCINSGTGQFNKYQERLFCEGCRNRVIMPKVL